MITGLPHLERGKTDPKTPPGSSGSMILKACPHYHGRSFMIMGGVAVGHGGNKSENPAPPTKPSAW
jgi:hypothetical protein